ncbi:MAG: ribonucleoside-diphosphate reductase subunit alpha, partial [Alphaproteobacteria bacterium]
EIAAHGLRNSLLIAIAPTATISHICGVEECVEPVKANLMKRETLSGEFVAINRYMVEDLKKIGRWNAETINIVKRDEGSLSNVPNLPDDIRELYKPVWEMSMKSLVSHAVARGAYIDQSQSLNMFIDLNKYPEAKRIGVLSSLYMFAWEKGVKTTYYFRSRAATRIEKVTVDKTAAPAPMAPEAGEVCESCT